MLNLMIHCAGSETVNRVDVVNSREPTSLGRMHHPIHHFELLQAVEKGLEEQGFTITGQAHGLGREGTRYFGLMELRHDGSRPDYSLVVGLRNSHDRSLSAGLVSGSGVFVCDNLAFSGEIKISRKHTPMIRRDLPELVGEAIERLRKAATIQDDRLDRYKTHSVHDFTAHDFMIRALRVGVVPASKVRKVAEEWHEPSHDAHRERGKVAWRLFNAFTSALKGSCAGELPRRTIKLQSMLNDLCNLN